MKATRAEHCRTLEQIPNIGPALAADLRILGLLTPAALVGQDPYALYERLARLTGQRQDPCVLDTFIAATRFMAGDPARPWWHYTPERKRALARRPAGLPDAASAARPAAAGPLRPARQTHSRQDNQALIGLTNLGPASRAMLLDAGIQEFKQLHTLGAARAYVRVRQVNPKASLNLLWALEGALTGRPWREVARTDRLSLLLQVETITLAAARTTRQV